MNQMIQLKINEHIVPINISSNKKAKRYILKADHVSRQIKLTTPTRYCDSQIEEFITAKQNWIWQQYKALNEKITFQNGLTIPILGKEYKITYLANGEKPIELVDNMLLVSGRESLLPTKIKHFLQQHIKSEIITLVNAKSKATGENYSKITLKEMKSRWGSCNSKRTLCFCWRIVFAPQEVLDYLVAHEVAHLTHMNHSPQFWQLVAQLNNDCMKNRNWLKKNGSQLYLYNTNIPL
jgi:predicted metal-dependent hydrolase